MPKEFKTIKEQLKILEDRGLNVDIVIRYVSHYYDGKHPNFSFGCFYFI